MTTREILRTYLGTRVDPGGVVHLVASLPKAWVTTMGCPIQLRGSRTTNHFVTCLNCAVHGLADITLQIEFRTESDEAAWGLVSREPFRRARDVHGLVHAVAPESYGMQWPSGHATPGMDRAHPLDHVTWLPSSTPPTCMICALANESDLRGW